MTVATTPGLRSRPSSFQLPAITAISWSPSTMWPFSSTMTTRSASPSSAIPTSARTSRTLRRQRLGLGGAAFLVDVEAVGIDTDRNRPRRPVPTALRAPPDRPRHWRNRHHAQTVERQVARQGALGEFDIAVLHALDPLGASEIGGLASLRVMSSSITASISISTVVRQLVAIRPEQLDAVVVIGVMRSRNHQAEVGAHRARQHCHRRGRHRAEQQHIHADRREARDQSGLDHIAGQTGILADHHPVAVLAALKHQARGLTDLERELGRDHAIGAPANAIGAEISTCHAWNPRPLYPDQVRVIAILAGLASKVVSKSCRLTQHAI